MKILPIILVAILFSFVYCTSCNQTTEGAGQVIKTISTAEAAELIANNQDNPDFHVIDVRTPAEYEEVRLENALNIDYYSATFKQDIDTLEKNGLYLVYCRSGSRSGKAMVIFKELGFVEAYDMAGGITKWIEEDRPVVEGDG